MNSPIKIGSRQSPLAIIQVEEVLSLLTPKINAQRLQFSTRGDIDKKTSLTQQPAENFFTDTLDDALLNGQIDVAIHSAKDLPAQLPLGLAIFALTKSMGDADAWVSKVSLKSLAKGAKIGTSSMLRQKQIKELYPDAVCVDIRGTIEERIALVEEGKLEGVVIAACALKRLGLEHLIKDIFPWEGMPLQGQLAVVGRDTDEHLKEIFRPIDVRLGYGKVVLVGAGPGDPDLITLKAIKALESADCVFYDYLADKSLLKYAPRAEHIYAGKRKGCHAISQIKLSRMLKQKSLQGLNVVRLKGGDPLIFGRGADEILYLCSYHINVEVIPGVSSATGIPSYLGVPLTARGISSSVAFVSGHGEEDGSKEDQPIHIPKTDTIVFLMALTKIEQILSALTNAGWDKHAPMMVISKGTRYDEQIIVGQLHTINELLKRQPLTPPALIIAGNVVNFYKPSKRKVLLHCGQSPQLYADFGQIIPWPMIEIKAIELSDGQRADLIRDLNAADLILLTSPTAVKHFMTISMKYKLVDIIKSKITAVIGRNTGLILQEFGVNPQIISAEETAKGFFKTLMRVMNLNNKKIFFPRSSMPNPFLRESLENEGAIVMEWTIYNNVKPEFKPLPEINIDGIIFTSPSTVNNFLEDYQKIPDNWEILSKGPVTESALKEAGYISKRLT